MNAWRLTRAPYKALDGIGGELEEGRWNNRGQRVVYTAAAPSLAVLETFVHLDLTPELLPDDYVLLEIDIPDDVGIERPKKESLPDGWDDLSGIAARAYGSQWLSSVRSPVLAVPSAILPEENNILINPRHPDAAKIKEISNRSFKFDPRLLKTGLP